MNGYNFTERVRKVLSMAREEAARLGHEYVGTEHILLGLIAEGEGVAGVVLQNLGVDPDELRYTVEQTVKKGRASSTGEPNLPYTSRAKKVLELAMSQARDLHHDYVGTEHLLLGLIAEKKGIAAQVLVESKVSLDSARAETIRILGTEMPAGSEKPKGSLAHTKRLEKVFLAAWATATELGPFPATPVILAIALLQHGDGAANAALDALDVDVDSVIAALGEADGTLHDADEIRRVLEATEAECRAAGAGSCDTGHLLVALLETTAPVTSAFANLGIAPETLRHELKRISG